MLQDALFERNWNVQVAIVGAGLAGLSLASKLRASGFDGAISIFGDEAARPYDRPPLSKAYLAGDIDFDAIALRPAAFFADNDISLQTGCKVESINRGTREIHFEGNVLRYDHLALTTGTIPRELPSHITNGLKGVYSLRSLVDADSIRTAFETARNVVIIGGGYIGLEIAAAASKRGLSVTVIEAAPRVLQRVAGTPTSDFFRALHSENGVEILENTGLAKLVGDGQVTGAMLDNGTEIPADLVVVGIGVTPNVALAEAADLELNNGIKTDPFGRTSDPNIWAAGDCASFPLREFQLRLESVQHATQQAELVAVNIMGENQAYAPTPWFWSDQYHCRLQIAGLNTGYDTIVTRPGTKGDGASHWYYRDGKLLATDAINDPQAFMAAKRLIEMGRSPEPCVIQNPEIKLKALLKPAPNQQ